MFDKGVGTLFALLHSLPDHISKIPLRFYFDKYFTNLPLIAHLSSMNYGATGTLRNNRVSKNSLS